MISDKNLILPEYKIDLLNKNKKIIKKVENIEKIDRNYNKQDFKRKNIINHKYKKNFKRKNKFKKKFNFHSKVRKNNFDNKKIVNY